MVSNSCLSFVTDGDHESYRLATTALETIAVSRRHLSIMEIAWAAALGTAQEDVATVAALHRLVEDLRVIDRIWPFFCYYRPWLGELRKRQFLPMCLNNVPRRHTEGLESRLLEVCIQYLLLCEIGDVDLLSEENVAYEELPESIDLFSDDDKSLDDETSDTWEACEDDMIRYDPTDRGFGELFVFASTYWLEYFGAVSDLDMLPRLEDIEKLCQAGSRRLHNWITQNSRPGCTVEQRFVFDSSLYDPLSITSLYGSEAMLQHMLENADLKSDKYLPTSVLNAAGQILQWGDLSRLGFLATSKHASRIRNFDFFRMAVMQ
ncbi:hypothetical protein GE09DRAFT_611652 [Coniochaeta sp. 2T2.1]|nr:hypothetical protein GE09DRAFT_611652 [Coniochaeta sp. 2T2.1]